MHALNAIRDLDRNTAFRVLAAAALKSAPSPDEHAHSEFEDKAEQLLSEARHHLRLRPDDRSIAAKAKIDNFLSSAISDMVPQQRADELLKKSGTAGNLPLSLYKVTFASGFMKRFQSLGIRERQVVDAIHRPTDFQHLLVDDLIDEDRGNFSLFMKEVAHPKFPHWLLVQSVRQGLTQSAQSAWRVLPDVVDLSGASSCLDVLKAFVDKFGMEVQFNGRTSKFIERSPVVRADDGEWMYDIGFASPAPGNDVFYSWSQIGKTPVENVSVVGLAYAIDLVSYKASLLKHGMG